MLAARGALWSGVAFGLNKTLILASSVVLARLLTPAEFGIVAVALVIVGYVERLSEGGLEAAVIAHPGSERDCLDHGLGISLALGGICCLLGIATAPLLAIAFDEPRLVAVSAALSALYLTTSIRQLLSGGLARRMQFGRRVGPELVRGGAKAGVTVGLALAGWGVWALVVGHVVGGVIGVVAYWWALGMPIRPRFSAAGTRPLLRAGGLLSVVSLLGVVVQNADYLLIAARIDSTAVGLYAIGFRIPELTVLAVPVVASQALIAAFTRCRDEPARLRSAYLDALSTLATVLVPLGIGLALIADDTVSVVFGPQWPAAAPVLALVGLYSVVAGLVFPFGDLLKATGRARVLVAIGAARVVVALPLLWFAAGRGLAAVATVHVAVGTVFLVVAAVLAARVVGAEPGRQLVAVTPPVLAVVPMVLAVVAIRAVVAPGLLRLLAAIVVAGAVYLSVLTLVDRTALGRLKATLRPGPAA